MQCEFTIYETVTNYCLMCILRVIPVLLGCIAGTERKDAACCYLVTGVLLSLCLCAYTCLSVGHNRQLY